MTSDTLTTGQYAAQEVDASLIGAVLGNYRITAAIGAGGMGSVYRAVHELLDRPAAIKLLRPELIANDDHGQRFFNEARAASAIRHPGIVEVYDFGYTSEGHAYFVMELLDGIPLSRAIAERGTFGEIEAASITRSIASALKAAHAKGIYHRDLKPDNVFLIPDPDGRETRVKVLDFGIAKLTESAATIRDNQGARRTQTGVLMGTPKYMAPEQAREAGTIDHRADLYSLGCILYELLVGQAPFIADGAGEIIAMQLFTEPQPPSKLAPVSPEMEHVVLRLLAKEPSERYQSAAELMDALIEVGARMSGMRDALDSKNNVGLSSSIRYRMSQLDTLPAITPTQSEPAPAKKSSTPFLLAGLALAIASATLVFFLTRKSDEPAPPPPEPVQPVVTTPAQPAPPPEPPVVVKKTDDIPVVIPDPKKPPSTTKTKKGSPIETRIEQRPERIIEVTPTERAAQTPPTTPKGETTEKGSPIESTLEDSPKKAP